MYVIDFESNKETTVRNFFKCSTGTARQQEYGCSATRIIYPIWPIELPYVILEIDEQCQEYVVIAYPNREYCWIMARRPCPVMPDATYDKLTTLLKGKHQCKFELRRVPQIWSRAERERRGLTEKEIPDSMLVN
jgi:lipocalin